MVFQLFGLKRLVLGLTVSVVQVEVAAHLRGPVSQPPHYHLR
jgi:hypothetical protein